MQRRSAAAAAAVVTIPISRSKAATVTTLGEPCSVVCASSRGFDSSPNPWVVTVSYRITPWLVQVLRLFKNSPLSPKKHNYKNYTNLK